MGSNAVTYNQKGRRRVSRTDNAPVPNSLWVMGPHSQRNVLESQAIASSPPARLLRDGDRVYDPGHQGHRKIPAR